MKTLNKQVNSDIEKDLRKDHHAQTSKQAASKLKRFEETEATKQIAQKELELWNTILGNRVKTKHIANAVQEELQKIVDKTGVDAAIYSLSKLLKKAEPKESERSTRAFQEALEEVVPLLMDIDADRELVATAAVEAITRSTLKTADGKDKLLVHALEVQAAACEVERKKTEFIKANQGLVILIAGRYRWTKTPISDLIQEGNLGLIKAVNRFDYKKGYQFSTYASWWIQSAIGRAIDNKEEMIRIPSSAIRNRSKLRNALRTFSQQNGRPPTDQEVRVETGMGRLKFLRTKKNLTTQIYSLDQTVSESNSLRFEDVLADEASRGPFEQTLMSSLTKTLSEQFECLSKLERSILTWRFGLDDCDELTLQEIAEQYGLSRERIRQIQNLAIEKLRQKMALDAA